MNRHDESSENGVEFLLSAYFHPELAIQSSPLCRKKIPAVFVSEPAF